MSEHDRSVPLKVLDPGYDDPGYWERFQRKVMRSAGPLLAQRRRDELTVEGLMLSWSRLVLPFALAAALAALVLLPRTRTDGIAELAGVEEVVDVPEAGQQRLPHFLHTNQVVDRDLMLFAVEGF